MKFINPLRDHSPGGFREFSAIAYPLIISNLSITLMHFVDRLFLSWSSTKEIAASAPPSILAFTMMAFFLGICEYVTVLTAQYHGAGNPKGCARSAWQGVFFALGASVVCIGLLPVGLWILEAAGHPDDILALEKVYFTLLWFTAPFHLLNRALAGFYAGRGRTRVVMAVNLFANALNAILDYLLIFGVWGFPQWGIFGAGVATLLSQSVGTLILLALFLSPRNHREHGVYSACRFDWAIMKRLIRFGAPAGAQLSLDVGAFTVFFLLVGRIGEVELAASNIVMGINMLAFMPMEAVCVAASALVGKYMGRREPDIARKSVFTALIAAEAFMLSFAVVYFCFPEPLMRLFEASGEGEILFDEVVQYGAVILIFVAFYQIADAMTLTFSGALRGAGDTAFAMWTSIILSWCIFVPGTWIAIEVYEVGIIGAWIWATAYIMLLGLIYLLRFLSGRWMLFQVLPDAERTSGESNI